MWCNNVSEEKLEHTNTKLWDLAQEVFELYLKTDTEEIWYKNLLSNQIFQLEYYSSFGKIADQQKTKILNAFKKIFRQASSWALNGSKGEIGSYSLSLSEYALLNNGGLFLKENKPLVLMTSLSSVFFLSTSHQETVDSYLAEYKFHKQRSTSITRVNERERSKFFLHVEKILSS